MGTSAAMCSWPSTRPLAGYSLHKTAAPFKFFLAAVRKAAPFKIRAILTDNGIKTPQTNGMVGPFNGRLSQVPRSHHLNSAEDLQKTLHRTATTCHKRQWDMLPSANDKTWKIKVTESLAKNVGNLQGLTTRSGYGLIHYRCSDECY